MTMQQQPLFCRADLNYVDLSFAEPVIVNVAIRDGRQTIAGSWQDCGFELLAHKSQVQHWQDQEVTEIHYAEIAALARQLTGCDHALVGSHIIRNPQQASLHPDLAPIRSVHSDFAASYGDLIRAHYLMDDAQTLSSLRQAGISGEDVGRARRLLILQFWRNVGAEKMDLPLAFCDARTVPQTDIRPSLVEDYAGGGFDFETLGIAPPQVKDQHQWYGFPNMHRDEVVAFRTYDSDRLGTDKPYWTPHSAFADPQVNLGEPGRSSIELRATCLFM